MLLDIHTLRSKMSTKYNIQLQTKSIISIFINISIFNNLSNYSKVKDLINNTFYQLILKTQSNKLVLMERNAWYLKDILKASWLQVKTEWPCSAIWMQWDFLLCKVTDICFWRIGSFLHLQADIYSTTKAIKLNQTQFISIAFGLARN